MNKPIQATGAVSGQEVYLKSTEGGAQHYIDLARVWTAKGYGYQVMATAAVACLIVRPTTVAIAQFYNNTSKNFVIDRVFAHNLVSIANGNFGIWLCVNPIGTTAPTNDITIRNSTIGLAASAEGIFDAGPNVIDSGWFPWGESGITITATVPGSLAQALIDGKIIIPPTAALSISCVGQTAVVTVCVGLHYFSVPVSEMALG